MRTCTFNDDRTAVIVSGIDTPFRLDPDAENLLAPLPYLHSEEEAEGFKLAEEFLRSVEWAEEPKPGPFLVPGDALPPADPPVDVLSGPHGPDPFYATYLSSRVVGDSAKVIDANAKALGEYLGDADIGHGEPARTPDDLDEAIDHPVHYGGADDPYEAIKVIRAWGLDFSLGNAVKYICRAGKKGPALEDLKKARWYLDEAICWLEKGH
ncbi:MAG: DUF3310 domain-containing protein [Acidobacteria bacterium]|nr:DUF3310 domain-containing protein [Acidobacteriota bacterium]